MHSKPAIKNIRGVIAACFLLIAFLSVTIFLWRHARNAAEQNANTSFQLNAAETMDKIKGRMLDYEQVMRGAVGLFAASKSVERDEWRIYVNTLKIEQSYPGIQGISFAKRVLSSEKDAHIREIRLEGFSDYNIWPEGKRKEYYPIVYLEPFEGQNRIEFGYDVCVEPVHKAAMELARDTGGAAITGKIRLVQETEKNEQGGFRMFLPIYENGKPHDTVPQRRANLIGFVTSPFRMNDLMRGILGKEKLDIDMEIFDGAEISEKTLMYDSAGQSHPQKPTLFRQTTKIDMYGRTWTFVFSSTPAFEASIDKRASQVILFVGIFISILISATAWLFSERHAEIISLNQMLEKENAERMQSLSLLDATLDSTADGILVTDTEGRITGFNKKFSEMWPEAILASTNGNKVLNFAIEELKEPHDFYAKLAELYKKPGATSFDVLEFKDSRVFEANSLPQTLHNKTIGRVWSFRDIAKRRHAERQLQLASRVFENSGEAIVVTDAESNIISVNKSFAEITGYASEEVMGKNPRMMRSGRHDADFYKKMWAAINENGH